MNAGKGVEASMDHTPQQTIHQWGVFEQALVSSRDYECPLWDVTIRVELTSPSRRTQTIEAFWDGGRDWRFRSSPEEPGVWTWQTECSDSGNADLHCQSGQFRCTAYTGDNPLYRHGPLTLSEDRHSLAHADGTPFFWLGDTAWNGALRSREEEWQTYLSKRREQKFTAIQFVATQWRGARRVLPEPVFTRDENRLNVNVGYFWKLDQRLAAVNEAGQIAAPVMLWALRETDPGQALPEKDAIRLARYIAARWGAHQVVWFLGGDGRFGGQNAERWRAIGRGVFGERHDRLATLHPVGLGWVLDEFTAESWFDFVGYQSGHSSAEDRVRWLIQGPPAREWRREPARPIINLEPNCERHPDGGTGQQFGAHSVRRAAYWSLLVSPTAGVSYGNNPIWVWNDTPMAAEGHGTNEVPVWRAGLDTEGIRSMTLLQEFFASGPWHRLRPVPEAVREQPGEKEPAKFIAAARTEVSPH